MIYRTVYADPPWEQENGPKLSGKTVHDGTKQAFDWLDKRAQALPYKTMSLAEICQVPVNQIAAADSHLWLWTTNKHLMNSKSVVEAWGFTYKGVVVWKKKRIGGGLGGVLRNMPEYLVFATKGKVNAKGLVYDCVIEAKRPYVNGKPCHSKKPEIFREIIESVSNPGYIELFARHRAPGWAVWGDQVESDILLSNHR